MMARIPEPELMNNDEQAIAYAHADFSEPHNKVIQLFRERFGLETITGYVLDLGCGPGDIAVRFARAFPHCIVHGIDGADAMLRCGRNLLQESPDIKRRVELFGGILPDASPPRVEYDAVISNSLLHHLMNPFVLWKTIKKYAALGAPIFIVDLKRPTSSKEARMLVETYSKHEPEILKRDFFNSLLAAFNVAEIKAQLHKEKLDYLEVKEISDRHLQISGYYKR